MDSSEDQTEAAYGLTEGDRASFTGVPDSRCSLTSARRVTLVAWMKSRGRGQACTGDPVTR